MKTGNAAGRKKKSESFDCTCHICCVEFNKVFINNLNEWHSEKYHIVEINDSIYLCYKQVGKYFNHMSNQPKLFTPECAMEFCRNDAGIE